MINHRGFLPLKLVISLMMLGYAFLNNHKNIVENDIIASKKFRNSFPVSTAAKAIDLGMMDNILVAFKIPEEYVSSKLEELITVIDDKYTMQANMINPDSIISSYNIK